MNVHRGRFVEYLVRKRSFNINGLAKSLNINRRTLYNWFSQKDLSLKKIKRIEKSSVIIFQIK
jgi:hypothetical protein